MGSTHRDDGGSAPPAVRPVTGPLAVAVAAEVRATADAVQRRDGVEALGEQTLLRLTDPAAPVVHLVANLPQPCPGRPGAPTGATPSVTAVETVVGYAQVDLGAPGAAVAELAVHPEHRRRGLGRALLLAARSAARDRPLQVWAHGSLPAAQAMARSAGMHATRELLQLHTGLRPPSRSHVTGRGLPEGVVVRPFVVGRDEEAWLRLNAAAFAGHPEQGRMTLADLAAREREPWFDPAGFLLAVPTQAAEPESLLAAVWTKVPPGSDEGEIYVLAVDPDAQGRGLGATMTGVGLDHLAGLGLAGAMLFTEADNTAALRTYRGAGFSVRRSDVVFTWG